MNKPSKMPNSTSPAPDTLPQPPESPIIDPGANAQGSEMKVTIEKASRYTDAQITIGVIWGASLKIEEALSILNAVSPSSTFHSLVDPAHGALICALHSLHLAKHDLQYVEDNPNLYDTD